MALASTVAGIAFSGAGVHVPHALAYPIASLQHDWRPPGYGGAAFVPHGFAVAVTAPAVFRLVADAVPERCATAARLLDGGDDLADSLARLMEDVGAPTAAFRAGLPRGRHRKARPRRARPAAAARGLAEGHRRRRARGPVEDVAVSEGAWPTSVAVVGAGTMGVGIAHVFAAHACRPPSSMPRPSCPREPGRVPSSSSPPRGGGNIEPARPRRRSATSPPPRRSRTLSAAPT